MLHTHEKKSFPIRTEILPTRFFPKRLINPGTRNIITHTPIAFTFMYERESTLPRRMRDLKPGPLATASSQVDYRATI